MRQLILAFCLAVAVGLPILVAPGLAEAEAEAGCAVHAHGHVARTHCPGAATVPYRPGHDRHCVWRDHIFTQNGQKMHQQRQVCR